MSQLDVPPQIGTRPVMMAAGRPMRILLVDDQTLFREGIHNLLKGQPDLEVVGEAGTVSEALLAARQTRPDLILMDFSLPDGSGLDATQKILSDLPETKIVFLSIHIEDDLLIAAIRAGARGYLPKNIPVRELIAYLRSARAGEAAIPGVLTSRIFDYIARRGSHAQSATQLSSLTPREREILGTIASGAANADIASHFGISESTVKNHVRSILRKLSLHNRREAAALFRSQPL